LVFGPWVVRKLKEMQVGQPIREDGPTSHFKKAGTPTMGGVLIIGSMTISTLLWADLTNSYIILLLIVMLTYAAIGFIDDYRKQVKGNSKGLPGRYKLFWQIIVGILVGSILYLTPNYSPELSVPFFKNVTPNLGWLYIPFAIFVIVGASNAVNLTDGLDGLAIGPVVVVAVTYLLFSYFTGNVKIADYLLISHVPGTGELSIFCGTMIGAGIGFLWYNSYPAEIFMGDVGALPLGGCIGTVAVATKHELLLVIVGGLFVIETLSVIFQVGFFKLKQRRIFKMAPLHHHFELLGWPEPKIIVRFWIISIILALIAISTLKIR
jgi:phospho-N-acetylmuramoyl-pentapeptide-transferase